MDANSRRKKKGQVYGLGTKGHKIVGSSSSGYTIEGDNPRPWTDSSMIYMASVTSERPLHDVHKVKLTKPIRLVKWKAPAPGTFKINVDGSSRGNPSKSGVGGLIRDSNGTMMAGFLVSIGFNDILYAELFVIKYGLELAWKKGCKKVICESDFRDALQSVE
ncbi:ribonuclease H [Senna tora]|uniref:Ribonuclease H n=1 Tax=Senna tora TaxID=362788 RepID=A0A834TGA8_9FABA|nr:ribonuclease H [Senna tora]